MITAVTPDGNASVTYMLNVIEMPVHSYRVVVQVHDIYGEPLEGATVSLAVQGATFTDTTNSTGSATFTKLPAGTVKVTATYMGVSTVVTGSSLNDPMF